MAERTRIRLAHKASALPTRSAGPPSPAAFERTPTLVGGEVAGSHGAVQVWAPDLRALKRLAARSRSAWAIYLFTPLVMMPVIRLAIAGALPLAAYIACFVGCFLPWLGVGVYAALRGGAPSAHRRPRYLATDEAGIGITMASGSRYLVWDDIVVAMNAPLRSGMMLCTHSGEKIRLNLTGYPSDVQAELWTLIVRNVGLHPASQAPLLDGRSWHARRGFRVSAVTGRVTQEPNAALPTLNRTRVLSPGLDAADSATQAQ